MRTSERVLKAKENAKILLCLALAVSCAGVFSFTVHADTDSNIRTLIGRNRFQTAVKTSQYTFNTSDKVVLVDGYDYQSMITAVSISSQEKVPILYWNKNDLFKEVISEIARLGAKEVVVIGDSGGLSIPGVEVSSITADNAYDLNYKVSSKNKNDTAILVDGTNYPDAVSASSVSYLKSYPIFIADKDNLNSDIENELKTKKKIYIIGGINSISENVVKNLPNVERISGNNRYETAEAVKNKFFPDSEQTVLASGDAYPDSLCGGYVGSQFNTSILLTREDDRRNIEDGTIAIGGVHTYKNNVIYVNPHQDDEILTMGLELVRDIKSGKNVYFVQTTRGNKTSVRNKINGKYPGKYNLTENDIAVARNKELELCLKRLGFYNNPKNHIYYLNYGNLKVKKDEIIKNIDEIETKNNLNTLNTAIKTMKHDKYDSSAGGSDHKACEDSVINFRSNDFYSKTYIPTKSNLAQYPNSTEKEALVYALNAYKIWDPNKGFFSIGYLSSGRYFDSQINNTVYYR